MHQKIKFIAIASILLCRMSPIAAQFASWDTFVEQLLIEAEASEDNIEHLAENQIGRASCRERVYCRV